MWRWKEEEEKEEEEEEDGDDDDEEERAVSQPANQPTHQLVHIPKVYPVTGPNEVTWRDIIIASQEQRDL